ncbi:MAG: hypothetical protein U0869_06515 [Chloroflexota bacterium]
MTQSPPPKSTPTRRPKLGALAIVAGILGLIISIAGIGGSFAGKTWAGNRLDDLANAAKSALDNAVNVSDEAITKLQAGVTEATNVQTSAEQLAANPSLDETAVTLLQQKLAPLGQKYSDLRDRFAALGEKATNVIDTVQRLDKLIPGLDLPSGPGELVQNIGDRLKELDSTISDIQAKAATRTGASDTANVIAVSAGRLVDGLNKGVDTATQIQTKLIGMQDRVDKAADRLNLYVTMGTGVLMLFFLWLAILNLALIALGRRWRA